MEMNKHINFELHKTAHGKFMELGYYLGMDFTYDDRGGLEDAIIAAYLDYTDFAGMESVDERTLTEVK